MWSMYMKMMGRVLLLRTTAVLVVFFLWIVKYLKNFQIIDFLITLRNVDSFLNFSMVSSLLNQSQLFCQIYLIELAEVLLGLGLLSLLHLIHTTLSLAFLTNSNLMEFFCKNLWKNIQLILELLKVSFLGLSFSYYRLMNFLMMLSVILFSTYNDSKCDQV